MQEIHKQSGRAGGAPLPAFERWLLRGTLTASAIYAVAYLALWISSYTGTNDFFVFWSAARWVAEHGFLPQIYDVEAFHAFQAQLSERPNDAYRPFA